MLKGSWRILRKAMWKRLGRDTGGALLRDMKESPRPHHERMTTEQDDEMYQQFLRGEGVTKDEAEIMGMDNSMDLTPQDRR